MKQGSFTITENYSLTPTTWLMRLKVHVAEITAPGQFINIRLDGHFLRRPISVNDVSMQDGTVTIIYKVLGRGTEEMTHFMPGRTLDVLTGLGNGYDLSTAGNMPLLIGGGVGIPPLYLAAKKLMETSEDRIGGEREAQQQSSPQKETVILGFNSEDEMYYVDEFEALGCDVYTATADGSAGIRGFVTAAFREIVCICSSSCLSEAGLEEETDTEYSKFSHFYTCGPEPMLRAVYDEVFKGAGISGQMSFEERMGCGFGACMGCSIRTTDGYKRICKDGPVLKTEEILW